jgi:hypothetical protein
MRTITRTVAHAFLNGTARKVGNTHTDGTTVYLHGNAIVTRKDDGVYVSLAGWNTNTTRERISGVLRHITPSSLQCSRGVGVSTHKGQARLHDVRGITDIDDLGWHRVSLDSSGIL